MKTNKRRWIAVTFILIAMTVVATGCKKGSKDEELDTKTMNTLNTVGGFQDMVSIEASKKLAEKYNIDISSETMDRYFQETFGELKDPEGHEDILNNPKVIATVIGMDAFKEGLIPVVVQSELVNIFTADTQKPTEEEMAIARVEFEGYLTSLKVSEDKKDEVIIKSLLQEGVNIRIENEYDDMIREVVDKLVNGEKKEK